MQILVLDSIHGGRVLGNALGRMGHRVDLVDVYRGDCTSEGNISPGVALAQQYDLLIHPVHLDPAYPLLRRLSCPAITHHQAVRWILKNPNGAPLGAPGKTDKNYISIQNNDNNDHGLIVEITGTRGKTTTATALASIFPGPGILHTTRGTYRYPDEEMLGRMSITPASLITACSYLRPGEWFIGEVSLGFTGIGDLAILTSDEDYPVGAGRLSAKEIKRGSGQKCSHLLVPHGLQISHEHVVSAADLTSCTGTVCEYRYREMRGRFENPLISLEGYRAALQLAASAGLILGFRPDGLSCFEALPGRMKIKVSETKTIIDNSCSGAGLQTTNEAISLLIKTCGSIPYTLVIGQEERAVCENFATGDIIAAVMKGRPAAVIVVAGDERIDSTEITRACQGESIPVHIVPSFDDAMDIAKILNPSAIVTSVKTWR